MIEKNERNTSYLVETHAHTAEVSPCGRLGARDLARAYHKAGYQCLIVTDHYRSDIYHSGNPDHLQRLAHFWSGYEIARAEGELLGLTVLPGMELGFDGAWSDHLLYGISPAFLEAHPFIFSMKPRELHGLARENGILVVQAHPFRTGVSLSDPAFIDGVETWNANLAVTENRKAHDFAAKNRLLMTAGSDCHAADHVGKSGMVFDRPVTSIQDFISLLSTATGQNLKTQESGA